MKHIDEFTIKSRALNREITFSRPGKHYIFVNLNGHEGSLGNQICSGGSLCGSTVSYAGDSQSTFEKICRNWFSQYRAYTREFA